MHVHFHELTKCNTDLYVCFDPVCLFVSLPRGDFLIRSGGLKISSMITSQNVKLILRGFENSFLNSSMVFVTKTKCQFLPLAAICRKIKHSFISFLFHVPATLKDVSSLVMQEVWAVKIYATFWLIFSAATPSDFQSLQELGEGHCLSKKAHSNGSDLVAQLGGDCSRVVDICLQNS